MQDCIFCKIIKKEIPCHKIYEDENSLAFLDINPVNKGHTLVIPKEHHKNIEDIPEDLLSKVINTVKKVSKVLLKQADGVNVIQSNKPAAGQEVMHLHFHLIPRYKDDNKIKWPTYEKYQEGEAEQTAEKIKNLLK